jgi:hypothetical protein
MNNYITISEVHQHSYVMIPKELFVNERYSRLTNNSRVLYAFLLDRLHLSTANLWYDKEGRVYLIFSRENLAKAIGVSTRQITREMNLLKELDLVEEKVNGLNKPNWIYLKKINYEKTEIKAPTSEDIWDSIQFVQKQAELKEKGLI